jgi:uncharacterized RDD family membrane protein YckC
VITVAAVGVLLQLGLPLALMFAQVAEEGFGAVRTLDPDRGAFWKGNLWLVETGTALIGGRSRDASLVRWTGGDGEPLQPMARFDVSDPRLLPAADRLWIVARDAVGWLGTRGLEIERAAPASTVTSYPFLWKGRPALVGETSLGPVLFSFEEGAWVPGELLDLGSLDAEVDAGDLYLHEGEGQAEPWFFARTATTLLVGRGLPAGGGADLRASLETAVEGPEASGQWSSAIVGGEPLLATVRSASGRPEIAARVRRHGEWADAFTIGIGLPGVIAVFPDDRDPRRVLVVCQGYPGSLKAWKVEDGEVRATFRLGRDPMEEVWLSGWQLVNYALTLLIPILAVLLLAPVLARHRTVEHRLEGPDGPAALFASLPRRALAKGVDAAIILLPAGLAAIPLLGSSLDVERTPGESLGSLGAWLGIAFGWSVLCWLVFSVLEARFGRTPGKGLAGIRVATLSGQRVSVGRALLRNLLLMVDGTLGGLVGIVLIALTPRWQRLGDLAAKTLVIRG